ncbi:MAG TPA: hypothetical protein VFK05_09195 [Polyangiaceae bacterium]|nr:hypothetical protein [Polyangiaceae bacterium]
MKVALGMVVLGVVAGCSGGGGAGPGAAPGVSGASGASAAAGASGETTAVAGASPNGESGRGGSDAQGGGPGAAGSAGLGGTGEAGGANFVQLPPGSKEVDGVVNLVDADAAAELDQFIVNETRTYPTARHSLNKSLNLFLERYLENYDFVFFFTDHLVPNTNVAAKFEDVTRKAEPGGTLASEIAAEGYETTGRVRGVIGVQYTAGSQPAIAHEVMHHWGVYLDDKFGFGKALDDANGAALHWGYTSVNGQLGGFDGSTLRCETPANALPPNCTPLASGRTRYVTGVYAPQTNTFRDVPYAPLELYLMGLLPASEVPPSIQMLTGATFPVFSADGLTATTEAAGVTTLNFADIQARHGTPPLLPESARHFDAAFVVLSATPVPDSVMSDVATWAATFGDRKSSQLLSFKQLTGGRATMNTVLGARREVGTSMPPARAAASCDLVAQDCSRPELACYLQGTGVCGLSRNQPRNAPCSTPFDCARGLDCISNANSPNDFKCSPYCDSASGAASAVACSVLCPGKYAIYTHQGSEIGAICVPD